MANQNSNYGVPRQPAPSVAQNPIRNQMPNREPMSPAGQPYKPMGMLQPQARPGIGAPQRAMPTQAKPQIQSITPSVAPFTQPMQPKRLPG